MSDYPDRSRFDADVAAILNPLAQLRAANDALLAENESLLDGAAKRQEYVEAIEAQNAALVRRIHELVIGNVLLRHGLDTLAAHLWGDV